MSKMAPHPVPCRARQADTGLRFLRRCVAMTLGQMASNLDLTPSFLTPSFLTLTPSF